MTEFVEECRREWKRLRVPAPLANEMAADLSADLKEAEAEGASPEDVLGNAVFDPQAFAASWARERGLIQPTFSDRLRAGTILAAVAAAIVLAAAVAAAVLLLHPSTPTTSSAQVPTAPAPTTTVGLLMPNLVGLHQTGALARARTVGIKVTVRYRGGGSAPPGVVVEQSPPAGAVVAPNATVSLVVQR